MKLFRLAAPGSRRTCLVGTMLAVLLLDLGLAGWRHFVPESVRPSDANFRANPAGYGALLTRLAAQSGRPCDVIFIGASNVESFDTEGRVAWDRYYASRHSFDFGIGGDRTQDVLWRFDHVNLSGLHPKVAVIFVGLNNLPAPAHDVALGIEAVVQRTRAAFPGVRILLVGLTPNYKDDALTVAVNRKLREFADNESVFYVDLHSHMPREGNNWKGLGADHYHLTAQGYEMWAEQMEPYMQRLLAPQKPVLAGEKTRLAGTQSL